MKNYALAFTLLIFLAASTVLAQTPSAGVTDSSVGPGGVSTLKANLFDGSLGAPLR